MTTEAALEAALVANPDDFVTHCAYADYLIENGDIRAVGIRAGQQAPIEFDNNRNAAGQVL